MRDQLMLEQSINNEMNAALQQGQFCFYLQPLYSITTGQPTSAEALVRWQHPQKGLIPPRDFVPLFERNGFITRMDTYLWESVCKYLHDLKAEGIAPLPISVNVSRINLFNPNLCNDIIDLVKRYELSPSLIKLEITESAYTDHPEQLLSVIQTLRQYGFQILMDDFGSGYSSLSMLKDLTVDILKVDMRFLTGMESNGRAANVMTSIIRMAKWLNIVVVAEGVETQTQIDFLRSVGCDEVQGYYYSKPMPVDAFTALLRDPDTMRHSSSVDRESLLVRFDLDALWDSNQQISLLFNGMVGAIGLYEKVGDMLELLRVNDSYYELMGTTPQTMLQTSQNGLLTLEPQYRQALLHACERATSTHAVEQAQVCCPHADGHILWLDIRVRHLGTVNIQELYYFALSDITRQKELEHNYLLYQYGTAMLDAYSEVMEINFTDNIATTFSFNGANGEYHTRTLALDALLSDYTDTRVHPMDRLLFVTTCNRESLSDAFVRQKRRCVSMELRMREFGKPYHWARLIFHPMDDSTGKFRTLCCSRTIDEQKQSERIRAEYAVLQAKQQEQERYRIILEQTQTALLAWYPGSTQAEGNQLAQNYRLCAVSCQALLTGDVPCDVADPQDMEALQSFLASLYNHTSAFRMLRLALRDGETRWCKLCVTLQRDADEHVVAVLATVNDVDQEHRMRLQLDTQREQNERRLSMLSHLYWSLPCCILQLDLNDPPQPIFFNRACWELFGFQTKEAFDEIADQDIFNLIIPEERDFFLAQLRRCRTQSSLETVDITVTRPDGTRGSLRGNAAMSHMSDGRPMLQLVLLDTTVQREQERRLERTKATLERTTDMLQHLLESLPVGVTLFEFGKTHRALYVNTQAYSMFGLKAHQTERFMELVRLDAFHLDDSGNQTSIQAIDNDGINMNGVTRVQREDGTNFWLRTYYTVVPQLKSPPLCYIVLVDVSRQVEMERAYNRQSELYRITMEDSQQIFFDYDLEKDVMNYTIRVPSGRREDREVTSYLKTLRHSTIIFPEHISGLIASLRKYCRVLSSGSNEFLANFFNADEYHWYRAYFRSLADESGALYRIIGRVVDIQEEKARDAQLGQAKVFRRAVNSVSLFVFAFDLPDNIPRLLSCEDPKRAGFYPYLDYLNTEHNDTLVHEEERASLMEALASQMLLEKFRSGKRELTLPFRALNRQQNWIWLEMNVHLSVGEERNAIVGIGYVKIIEDRIKLERNATFDGLTQLLNRATMEERIERFLSDEGNTGCLMIFDIDNFKGVNDRFGHCVGDSLLKDVAGILRARLRQTDIVGRLGGDEFVALLRNAPEAVAAEKSRELLTAIAQLSESNHDHHNVTISIGYACTPEDGNTFADLYKAADRALYVAKRSGKNRCCSAREHE